MSLRATGHQAAWADQHAGRLGHYDSVLLRGRRALSLARLFSAAGHVIAAQNLGTV